MIYLKALRNGILGALALLGLIAVLQLFNGCKEAEAIEFSQTLSWTSPNPNDFDPNTGEPLDTARCASYQLRHTADTTLPFDQWTQVPTPTPSPVGQKDSTEIVLQTNTVYYFQCRGVDRAGNRAEWGNIVKILVLNDELPENIADLVAH